MLGAAKKEVKQDDIIECYDVKVSCKHKKPPDKELQINTGHKSGVKNGKCSCNTCTKSIKSQVSQDDCIRRDSSKSSK